MLKAPVVYHNFRRARIHLTCYLPNFQPTDAHGGALVNLIHGYTDNGDPFIRQFTDQLLEEVCPHFCRSCTIDH